jgi:hypothetical protein
MGKRVVQAGTQVGALLRELIKIRRQTGEISPPGSKIIALIAMSAPAMSIRINQESADGKCSVPEFVRHRGAAAL